MSKNPNPMSTLYILWGSFCSTIVLFMVLPQIIQKEIPPEQAEQALNVFVPVFGALSLPILGTSLFLRNLLYFKKRDDMTPEQRQGTYQTTCIISWGMAESIGIFGFVASFLSGNDYVVFPFAALSLALMLFYIPRAAHMDA